MILKRISGLVVGAALLCGAMPAGAAASEVLRLIIRMHGCAPAAAP